jgi:hypothetical protein
MRVYRKQDGSLNLKENIMKKTFIVIIIFMLSMIMACNNNAHSTTEDQEAVKARVQQKIVFYKTKLIELSGLDEAVMENEMSFTHLSEAMGTPYDDYDREDLPQREPIVFEGNGIDPEMMINTSAILEEYLAVLDLCDDYVEDSFVVVDYEPFRYTLKSSVEGDLLFIESYRTLLDQPSQSVAVDIMEFDLIEGKVMFRYLRDYDDVNREIAYEEFSETGNILHAQINAKDHSFVAFQLYDRERNLMIRLSHPDSSRTYMNFDADDGSAKYSIRLGEEGNITRYNILFGFQTASFTYSHDAEEIHLYWNLHLVQGWNRCRLFSYHDDQIFQNEIEKLQDFSVSISIEERFAGARLTIPEALFTSSLMDLSDYGLFFDAVTFDELQSNLDYIDQNYLAILAQYELSLNMSANYDYVVSMLPFSADEAILEELRGESDQ